MRTTIFPFRSRRALASALALAALAGPLLLIACGGSSSGRAQPNASRAGMGGAGSNLNGASGAGVSDSSVNSGGTFSDGGAGASSANGAGQSGSGSDGLTLAGTGGTSDAPAGGAGGQLTSAGAPAACPSLPTAPIAANDVILFNDNGGWNWFQDERAVVDKAANKFVIGSVASGGPRNGNIEVVTYDVATGTKTLSTLGTSLESYVDDHNAPAFLVRPDGKYFAMWSGHRVDCYSRTSIFDGTAWSAENLFDWSPIGCPWSGSDTYRITYSNPWYIGSSIFAGVRSVNTNPALLTSADDGKSFSYYGRLIATGTVSDVGGYYKYWGNNSDRIDFVGTEAHPRDFDNSLYHGYIENGVVYDSAGTVKDAMLDDGSPTSSRSVSIVNYTPLFKTHATLNGVELDHAWNHDIVRYADGSIAVLAQARVSGTGSDDPDKRFIYARYDGSSWKTSYLGKAGHKLFADEQDYTGLSALHPDNPHVVFISTTVDPRDDTTLLARHELFEGVTCDDGSTWHWAPLTQNSQFDNLRPIVPRWDATHTLLLWLRGTYSSSQKYSLAVVGTTAGL